MAERLEIQLWEYFRERSSVVPEFKDLAQKQGLARTSMKNLAEFLIRLWAPARPKRPTAQGNPAGDPSL